MDERARQVKKIKHAWKSAPPHEINKLPPEAHTTALLLNYMRENDVPISMPQRTNKADLEKFLQYREHSSYWLLLLRITNVRLIWQNL